MSNKNDAVAALDAALDLYFNITDDYFLYKTKSLDISINKIGDIFSRFPYKKYESEDMWAPSLEFSSGPRYENVINLGGTSYYQGGGQFYITKKLGLPNRQNRTVRIQSLDKLVENRYYKMLISNIDKIIYKNEFLGYGIDVAIVFEYYESFGGR